MREFFNTIGWRRRLAIDGSLVLVLSLAGPFGTFVDLQWHLRLAYWAIAIGGCSILVHFFVGAVMSSEYLAGWRWLPKIVLGTAIAALPGATLIGVLERLLRNSDDAFDHFPWFWVCVVLLGIPVAAFQFMAGRSRNAAPLLREPLGNVPFLDRLPRHLGRDIVSISMQDHYVHVTTTRGSTLILIRFSDALKELAGYQGAQVHRSHWIAAGYARRLIRQGKRAFLELSDGRNLPVSRPYLKDARRLVDRSASPIA
jgi:hypothetical protein